MPWIYHFLLGIAFSGDVFIRQIVYLPTRMLVPVSAIKIAAIVAVSGLLLLRGKRRFAPDRLLNACMVLLGLYAILGFYVLLFRTTGFGLFPLFKAFGILIVGVLGIWAVSRILGTRQDLKRFALVLIFFGLWICLLTVPEILKGDYAKLLAWNNQQQFGVLGLPIATRLAIGYRIAPLVLLPALFIAERGKGASWHAGTLILAALIPGLFFLMVMVAGHRAAMAGMIGAVLFRQVRLFRVRETVAVVLAAVLLFAVVLNLKYDARQAFQRVESLFSHQARFKDRSLQGREKMFHASVDVINRYPVVGAGFGEFGKRFGLEGGKRLYPHNLFLEFVTDTGLLGLSLVAFVLLAMLSAFRGLRDPCAVSFFGMFIVYFVIANFSGDFLENHTMYMLLGLIPLFNRMKTDKSAKPEPTTTGGCVPGHPGSQYAMVRSSGRRRED